MMRDLMSVNYLVSAVVYSLLGSAVFWGTFLAIDRLTPYDLWHEIVHKQNRALATVVGAMAIGISLIVAASIHG